MNATATLDTTSERKVDVAGDDSVRFVLSAGRTGTVFLTKLMNQMTGLHVEHEPFPARYELVLGNLRNDLGIGSELVCRLFLSTRQKRFDALRGNEAYIEINPLICPIVDLLPELKRPLRVVHMVREPLSWARSITAFRASRRIRPFFHFIPFSSPFPTPRPSYWRRLTELERQLYRWRYCNEQILAQREHFEGYTLIRYEDLFHADRSVRDDALLGISETLRIDSIATQVADQFMTRENAAPQCESQEIEPDRISEICGDLVRQFGYA